MSETLKKAPTVQTDSPKKKAPQAFPLWARTFSAPRQLEIRQVFSDSFCFVDHDDFHKRGAEKQLFEVLPQVPQPDTSWYRPVIDIPSSKAAKRVVTTPLTGDQEKLLFQQFNYCRFQVYKRREKINSCTAPARKPPKTQLRDMLKWYRRSAEYRDQIAKTNLALVLAMAKRTRMSDMDFGDLISEGNMALLRAVDKFDVSRGFKFSTYACRAILKGFSRSGMKFTRYRQLFPTDFDPKFEKSDYLERCHKDHELDCADEVGQIVSKNHASLTEVEKDVIEHRFALGEAKQQDLDASPMTLEQVGRIIGLTKERVRQIQNKALKKIRVTLENGYLR